LRSLAVNESPRLPFVTSSSSPADAREAIGDLATLHAHNWRTPLHAA
jgi:hypothetical protein